MKMSRTRKVPWPLLALLAVVGCGDEGGRESLSATAPTSSGQIAIVPVPESTIETTIGEAGEGLSTITDAVLTTTGVAVLDGVDHRLKFFDRSGKLARTVGRFGDGPGEFRLPKVLRQCGDDENLWIWDAGTNRLIQLGPDGRETDRIQLPPAVGLLSCDATSLALGTMTGRLALPTENAFAMPGRITVIENFRRDTAQSVVIPDTVLAENRPLGAVASLIMTGTHLVFAGGTGNEVLLVDRAAGTRQLVPMPIGTRPATTADYHAAIEASAGLMRSDEERDMVRKVLGKIPPPDSLPAFRKMILGGAGEIWVTTSAVGAQQTEVVVIDLSDGTRTGTVALPKGGEVLAASSDRLLVRYPDQATGGSRLVVYPRK